MWAENKNTLKWHMLYLLVGLGQQKIYQIFCSLPSVEHLGFLTKILTFLIPLEFLDKIIESLFSFKKFLIS